MGIINPLLKSAIDIARFISEEQAAASEQIAASSIHINNLAEELYLISEKTDLRCTKSLDSILHKKRQLSE